MSLQCPSCHRPVREHAQFCTSCGGDLVVPDLSSSAAAREPHDTHDERGQPTRQMRVAGQAAAPAAPGPRPEDYLPGPASVGVQRTDTDPLPRAPRLGQPSVIVNQDQLQGENMSHDEIKDDPGYYDDEPLQTDRHPVHAAHAGPADVYDDEYDDEEDYDEDDYYEDDDAAPFVEVDVDPAVSDPGHSFRVGEVSGGRRDRKRELQSLLARIEDEHADEFLAEDCERQRVIHDLDAATDHGAAKNKRSARKAEAPVVEVEHDDADDAFQMGDASFIEDNEEIEFFGFASDEDSGPVPLTTGEFERITNPGLDDEEPGFRRPASRGAEGLASVLAMAREHIASLAHQAGDLKARFQGGGGGRRRSQKDNPQRRQLVIGLVVLFAVFGLGYAIFSDGDTTTDDSAESQTAEIVPIDSAEPEVVEPEYELVRLSTDDEPDADPMLDASPTGLAQPGAAPVAAAAQRTPTPVADQAVDAKFEKQNILVSSAIPASPESHKLTRACILRKGPASRFALIQQVDPGNTLQVMASSSEDWVSMAGKGGVQGWAKGCSGPDCQLRMGPGEQFRMAHVGDDTPKPTGRVISSARWRYVKYGETYGWVGPACFKP